MPVEAVFRVNHLKSLCTLPYVSEALDKVSGLEVFLHFPIEVEKPEKHLVAGIGNSYQKDSFPCELHRDRFDLRRHSCRFSCLQFADGQVAGTVLIA